MAIEYSASGTTKKYSASEAFAKISHYCAYQERSHKEVRNKLYGYGLHQGDVEKLLTRLITDGFLNEERYAKAFAGGKFRIKQWGRVRIKYELKKKQVSEYCIRKALATIDVGDYRKTLKKLSDTKAKTLTNEKNPITRKKKLQHYLLQKGFEKDLIIQITDTGY